MSALTDRIVHEHQRIFNARYGLGPHCTCGWVHRDFNGSQKHVTHIAEVTEAATRERVARNIEVARSQAPAWVAESHLPAWQAALAAAARIANGEQPRPATRTAPTGSTSSSPAPSASASSSPRSQPPRPSPSH